MWCENIALSIETSLVHSRLLMCQTRGSLFTPHCSSSLSHVKEYLIVAVRDNGGDVHVYAHMYVYMHLRVCACACACACVCVCVCVCVCACACEYM